MAFDKSGKYLSIGDFGGRCILFKKEKDESGLKSFEYFMEFQAHDKGIDTYTN
jgi:hypothetical protein